MYALCDIRTVHLEMTTRCNARCPQCPRNLWGGGVNPSLPQVELSGAQCRRIFKADFARQLNLFYMCGDYGDPVAARDTLEVFTYLRGCHETLKLKMHTNGSARASDWWVQLARTQCVVRFGIDGLGDSNQLYRRGTDWPTILRNATAFIQAGGEAEWAFIVFRHNEHQVAEAQRLAKEMGFRRFVVKRTKRFFNAYDGSLQPRTPVRGLNGELEYYIEPPSNPRYQLPVVDARSAMGSECDSYDAHVRTAPIACRAVKEQMIYVSAEGLVLPCCWLGNLYPRDFPETRPQVWTLIESLPEGKESLNALRYDLGEVLAGPFFQQLVPRAWAPDPDGGRRLRTCVKVCGACSVHDNQNAVVSL